MTRVTLKEEISIKRVVSVVCVSACVCVCGEGGVLSWKPVINRIVCLCV